ncbi:unnamed protein product [Echinostoma caproni]|uniref:Uncharacterized protein n=1 Tax=Echinostoma caproni TaxID=27848 RepID=A0A183ARG4_9TREM|nr:unnamed protein product [Echinostoma caproni]
MLICLKRFRFIPRIQPMSGWRVRSVLFAFCWLLLALCCLTVLWKVLGFLFLSHLSWHGAGDYVNWDLWTPAINVFSQPTWGIRQWWPVYVAKKIMSSYGSSVSIRVLRSLSITNALPIPLPISSSQPTLLLSSGVSFSVFVVIFEARLSPVSSSSRK